MIDLLEVAKRSGNVGEVCRLGFTYSRKQESKAIRAHWATNGLIIVLQAVLSMSYAFQWVVQVLYPPVDRGYESLQLIRLENNRRVM